MAAVFLIGVMVFAISCGATIVMAREWEPAAGRVGVREEEALTVAASSEALPRGAVSQIQGAASESGQAQGAASEGVQAQGAASESGQVQAEAQQTPLIILDPGHGGIDGGCVGEDILEKDINLEIAKNVRKKLRKLGYDVLMTREGDEEVSLEERVLFANKKQGNLYISIHQNFSEEDGAKVRGIETYYCDTGKDDGSRRLAKLIQKQMISYTQANDRTALAREDLYVIREADMPACLVETGFLSNRKERELLASRDYQDKLAEAIADSVDYYFHPKTMYLTFDDGPSAENTEAVLDILKERNIRATFFLVGENVERHPEIAKRIAAEGHTIGIHCNRHEYETIYGSAEAYVADFEEARQIIYEATGVETKLFRFPGGSINAYDDEVYEEIIEAMTEKGYIYYDWNASLEDAVTKSTPESLIANGVESTLGRNKVVMLAHDVVRNTTLCLGDLIDQFPEYEMLPLSEEVEPVQFRRAGS